MQYRLERFLLFFLRQPEHFQDTLPYPEYTLLYIQSRVVSRCRQTSARFYRYHRIASVTC